MGVAQYLLATLLLVCGPARTACAQPEDPGPASRLDPARALSQGEKPSQVRSPIETQPDELVIRADRATGKKGDVLTYEGYVDVRLGKFRLQCDLATLNEATWDVEAIGNVVYDHEGQRITGRRAFFNLRTRRGTIWDATGYTDQTPDGVTLFFEARRVDRTGLQTYMIEDGRITACEQTTPLWSFTTGRTKLTLNERVSIKTPAFRILNVPVIWLPYASVPIARRVRSSGFLLPSLGNSNTRGRSITIPYYQTFGESADVLTRVETFTQRGIGLGMDVRLRTSSQSKLNAGFFTMFDRLFGTPGPKQGGTAFYLDAGQHFPRGFVASADINVVSNFTFRQVFSDSLQQAISPEERTQIYLNNNFSSYSFNLLLQSRNVFLPQTAVTIRQLPSFSLSGRPQRIWPGLPMYLSFDSSLEGMRRTESSLSTPSIVQRLDLQPRLTLPLLASGGFSLTPSVSLRSTFYSDSADARDRTRILGESIDRRYVEAAVEFRPPAMERVFHHRDGRRWFKHLVESSITYRRIAGINGDFSRIIRFDEKDAVASTNELEYAVVSRFFTQRSDKKDESSQPHEWLSLRASQKYFFDPTFGGALVPGDRNQFFPINTLSGFSFGGARRHSSPIALEASARPLSSLFLDLRVDYDTREGAVRNTRLTAGFQRRLISFAQTWFYTRRTHLDARRLDPSTFAGNLLQGSVFLGNREKGLFGGFDLAYDFAAQGGSAGAPARRLITSTARLGYGFCCGSFQIQNTIFRVGLRNENRIAVAFTLNGIGSFGTQTAAGRRIFGP